MFSAIASHKVLSGLSLDSLTTVARLIPHLKRDILQPQMLTQSRDLHVAPPMLSSSFISFLSDLLGIAGAFIPDLWTIIRQEVWDLPVVPLSTADYCLFKEHGWRYGITALSIYPPNHTCTNPNCRNLNPLKKEEHRHAVVYTLSDGVQPAWNVHLYCATCNTNYHNNFSVCDGVRTYYPGVPKYILVGEHQYVEDKVVRLWIGQMLLGWFSATNASHHYRLVLADQGDYLSGWPLTDSLNTSQVWDGIVVLGLLEDHATQGTLLHVPHTGSQADRFKVAMCHRNTRIALNGQPDAVRHTCDKCMRIYDLEGGKVQAIVADGISIGRPCCGVFRCTNPLQNNRHRFCLDHFQNHNVCAVEACDEYVRQGFKTCSNPVHEKMERQYREVGTASFTLTERLQRAKASQPQNSLTTDTASTHGEDGEGNDVEESVNSFEISGEEVRIVGVKAKVGTVGRADDSADPQSEECEAKKSAAGNRRLKAQFGRRRTHNEQTLVRPCGIIFARATFYGAEAVSNFLVMLKNAFSIPGAQKPEHVFYDTNCDARQQAEKDPWFQGVSMCVDVWHFLNKHKVTHQYCQQHCNPAMYPELMNDVGKWFFNTSVAEQTNAWLGGYSSIVREMLPDKFDFFLDEMIRLRNVEVLKKLEKGGYNPSIL